LIGIGSKRVQKFAQKGRRLGCKSRKLVDPLAWLVVANLAACDQVATTLERLRQQVDATLDGVATNAAKSAKKDERKEERSVLISQGKSEASPQNGAPGPTDLAADRLPSATAAAAEPPPRIVASALRADSDSGFSNDGEEVPLPDLPMIGAGERKMYRRTQTRNGEVIDLMITSKSRASDVANFYARELDLMGVPVQGVQLGSGSQERISLFGRQGNVYFSGKVERDDGLAETHASLRLERANGRRK
jgi:hypothetical protein